MILSEHFDLALTQEELTTKKPTRKRDRSDHERQQLAADILSTSNALIRWANDQIDGHRTGHRVPDTVRQNTKLRERVPALKTWLILIGRPDVADRIRDFNEGRLPISGSWKEWEIENLKPYQEAAKAAKEAAEDKKRKR